MALHNFFRIRSRKDIVRHTAVVALLSVIVSLGSTAALVSLGGGGTQWSRSMLIATIVPLAVSIPVSWFTYSMQLRLSEAQLRFEWLSKRDDLTAAFNKRHFLEAAQGIMRGARNTDAGMSLLFVDLDYFKKINDRYGHLAGDACSRWLLIN